MWSSDDDGPGRRGRLADALAGVAASPSELAGLVVLLVGALAAAAALWWSTPRAPAGPPVGLPTGNAVVTVHVTGEVARAGLVELPAGARVEAAIRAAGGPSALADLAALNLARPVQDGERIVVPPIVVGQAAPTGEDPSGVDDGKVDLNRATAAELEALPGIGPVLAGRIVAWRESHGPFVEVGQLREVPGIGERTFQTLAELVEV